MSTSAADADDGVVVVPAASRATVARQQDEMTPHDDDHGYADHKRRLLVRAYGAISKATELNLTDWR